MLTTSVPIRGTVVPPPREDSTLGVFDLLDAAPSAGLELPCRAGEADLWFAETPDELQRAKTLCDSCPVRTECLAGALARREPWGVWGGEIFERGAVIERKRPRGRPRKTVELSVATGTTTTKQPNTSVNAAPAGAGSVPITGTVSPAQEAAA